MNRNLFLFIFQLLSTLICADQSNLYAMTNEGQVVFITGEENVYNKSVPNFDEINAHLFNHPQAILFDTETYVCDPKHPYRVEVVKRDPLLMFLHDFLSDRETEHLIAIAQPSLKRSEVVADEGKKSITQTRTSFSTFLQRKHDHVVSCIEERASHLVKKPLENFESLQVVWYRDGQEYQAHYDYFGDGFPGTERELERGAQRIATIFTYLNSLSPEQGGQTTFPHLDVHVTPKRGMAVFWYNVDIHGKDDPRTLHGGEPVHNTQKYGLNLWVRNGPFV